MTTKSQQINFEYRSNQEINGLPLIHINLGTNPETGRPQIAKGLVAIGNIAIGIVSVGGVAFGAVTLAGVGMGIVSLAGIAFGIAALGAIALGYEVSLGAIVLASRFAQGVITLDVRIGVWSLLFAALITLFVLGLRKVKALRPQN